MADEVKPEPFQVQKDYTNGYYLTKEDLQEKRVEIYNQIEYLFNMLRQIDIVYQRGDELMSEDEVRQYLKLDKIDERMAVPKDIPKIRIGRSFLYYRKDVKDFLNSRRR